MQTGEVPSRLLGKDAAFRGRNPLYLFLDFLSAYPTTTELTNRHFKSAHWKVFNKAHLEIKKKNELLYSVLSVNPNQLLLPLGQRYPALRVGMALTLTFYNHTVWKLVSVVKHYYLTGTNLL